MKILIIEDERELSDNIVTFLSSENYLCEQAFTFADAKMKVHLYEYECIVLDIMLPDGNGLELLKEIRDRHSQVGVIIVSAKDSINDKITGLEVGADDYLWQNHLVCRNLKCEYTPSSDEKNFIQATFCAATA